MYLYAQQAVNEPVDTMNAVTPTHRSMPKELEERSVQLYSLYTGYSTL